MTALALAFYAAGAAVMGYVTARAVWRDGTRDGVKPGNVGWTLFMGVTFAAAWPLLLALVTSMFVAEETAPLLRRVFTRAFGEPR